MSATEVITVLKEMPLAEREAVYRWLQQEGLGELWRQADAVLRDAPPFTEDEILDLPRVRPAGY